MEKIIRFFWFTQKFIYYLFTWFLFHFFFLFTLILFRLKINELSTGKWVIMFHLYRKLVPFYYVQFHSVILVIIFVWSIINVKMAKFDLWFKVKKNFLNKNNFHSFNNNKKILFSNLFSFHLNYTLIHTHTYTQTRIHSTLNRKKKKIYFKLEQIDR